MKETLNYSFNIHEIKISNNGSLSFVLLDCGSFKDIKYNIHKDPLSNYL